MPSDLAPERDLQGRFRALRKIGEGTYGVVYKAIHTRDNVKCALKMIRTDKDEEGIPSTCLREISCIKDLQHDNIVTLFDVIYANSGVLKIADFGLARNFSFPSRNYTHEVVTLWYRPPEILLGSQRYSTSLDMWSLGCIFAEIASNRPLFAAEYEITQLFKIFEIIGTPNSKNWPGVDDFPHYKAVFPQWEFDLEKLRKISTLDGNGLDVLREILRYPPERRLTAKGALSHRYFLQNGFTQNRPSVTELLRDLLMSSRTSSSNSHQEKSFF